MESMTVWQDVEVFFSHLFFYTKAVHEIIKCAAWIIALNKEII